MQLLRQCLLVLLLVLAMGGGAMALSQAKRFCGSTVLRIGEKRIRSFEEFSRFFSYYSLIPRIDSREMVAVAVEAPRPCGPFSRNMTLYLRASTKDVRWFKDVYQGGSLTAITQLFNTTKPQTILELGAHSGLSTVYLATKYPNAKIAALEPDISNFALLRLNTAPHKQVKHVEYGAAWDRASTVKLAVDGRGRSLFQRFVVDVVSMTTGRIGEVVAALNVRDLLDKYGWASVDLVISDMEGAERIVIADPSAKEWLSRVKCLAVRPYDPRTSSSLGKAMALLTSPRFIKRSVKGGMLTWCREDVGAL